LAAYGITTFCRRYAYQSALLGRALFYSYSCFWMVESLVPQPVSR